MFFLIRSIKKLSNLLWWLPLNNNDYDEAVRVTVERVGLWENISLRLT